ncbi:MAG: hypothetical protein U9O94_08635, partial [Nanoarchaeota archaeon]|nr:hypothetical protein [Nanoarchaeota archaeon]
MKDKLFYTKCLSIYSSYYSYTNDNQLLKLAMNMNSSNVIGIDRSFKAYFQKTYSMRPDNLNRSINRLTSSYCIAKINET